MTVANLLTQLLEPGATYEVTDWEGETRTMTFLENNDLNLAWHQPAKDQMVLLPHDGVRKVKRVT